MSYISRALEPYPRFSERAGLSHLRFMTAFYRFIHSNEERSRGGPLQAVCPFGTNFPCPGGKSFLLATLPGNLRSVPYGRDLDAVL